jgi:3-oxoacyl-[acyl-carrier-protein] synthase-3
MKHAVISGTGSYLPRQVLTNAELEKTLDTSHEWIVSRTGIESRHVSDAKETTSFMALQAAIGALDAAGLAADALDLIIVSTSTTDNFFPTVACYVQGMLPGARTIPAFDLSAACSGFVYALDVAKQYIAAGTARHVLVIGSECLSRAVDWSERSTCILFGDGAGAVVLSQSDTPGILGSVLHARYDEEKHLQYANFKAVNESNTSSFITMHGREVFKLAVHFMDSVVDEVLLASGLQQSDITWLVPHQANSRIIQAIAKKLNLPMSRVILTLAHQGNTSAASIPLALDHAVRNNIIVRGDVLLMEAFGGGMTWGAMAIRY